MNGITLITVLALVCGLLVHALKQFIVARRAGSDVTLHSYAVGNWPEGLLAVLSAAVMYLGIPELAALFPDVTKTFGITNKQTVLSSFVCGYMANSLADFLGRRVSNIAGPASKIVAVFVVTMVALSVTDVAHAQEPPGTRPTPCHLATPNNAICLLWTAPETNVDGTPTVLPLTYRVEHRVGAGSWSTIVTSSSARQHYATGLAIGRHEFRVYVNCPGCLESAASNVGARDATAPPIIPNPPALQVVQVVIGMDHAPVYLLTQSGQRDQRYKDACGYIEVGSACEGPVVYTFRQARFRRVSAADVKPWGATCAGFVVAPCS